MSDSRLEKFIYAICSMDVSDLPVPLSRIEKLWNCLITGETPDFEPLSRNEKYLMAMLDRYDISNLPAPMSRGEKLLYKIAVGETDLSDVPGYLSRYEELLKYLIENGGISGGDFEYVLYTLNQSLYTLYTTAEKPIKSAILKGQTLVNMVTLDTTKEYVLEQDGSSIKYVRFKLIDGFENDIYTIMLEMSNVNIVNPNKDWIVYIYTESEIDNAADNTTIKSFIKNGRVSFTYKPSRQLKTKNWFDIRLHTDSGVGSTITIKNVVVLKGDHTQEDIPYFEGMQSVKMPVLTATGKNLFDISKEQKNITINNGNGDVDIKVNDRNTSDFIKVIPNTIYKCDVPMTRLAYYDKNKQFISLNTFVSQPITIPTSCNFVKFSYDNALTNIQFEQGSIATSYEPYKANILTVNEDVTLRGIRDVHDTLDCLRGEMTERIGNIVLNGSLNAEGIYNKVGETTGFYFPLNTIQIKGSSNESIPNLVICDKFRVENHECQWMDNKWLDEEFLSATLDGRICIRLLTTKASTKDELRQYLSQNPITVQYILKTPTIKTVDLTVVDQDNQPTELGTFENVTHVSLEAENLIPEVEMKVATRISTELASASPLMDDISTKQEQLSTTIDEQSENVDATMIATTEIYEETL